MSCPSASTTPIPTPAEEKGRGKSVPPPSKSPDRKHWPQPRESTLTDGFKTSAKNFAVIALIVWCINLVYESYRTQGRWVDLTALWYFLSDVPAAVVINILFFAYLIVFYLLVKLIATNKIIHGFNALSYIIYGLLQLVLLTAPVALLAAIDPDWHFIAGAAVPMQSAVFVMKMHSYFFTYRHIYEYLHGINKSIDRDIGEIESLLTKKDNPDAAFRSLVTFQRFFDFCSFPNLCFWLKYPRTEKIRWSKVFLHLLQFIGGCLFAYVQLVHSLIPTWNTIRREPVEAYLKSLLPGFIIWMTLFFSIFHGLLNFVAELTRYADRRFYGPWWEASCMNNWWRDWNCTVTDWMRRHIYFQSRNDAHFPGFWATLSVFVTSALWHEYVIIIALHFSFLPPFLSSLMIFQLGLIALTELPIFKHTPLGNAIIWLAFIIGYPTVLYSYAACSCLKDDKCL